MVPPQNHDRFQVFIRLKRRNHCKESCAEDYFNSYRSNTNDDQYALLVLASYTHAENQGGF